MSTALDKYQRIEASALWRASPDAQRRDVIVSIGDASLVISDLRDRALTHWSLPAVRRQNPGARPAIFHPDGDAGETLEIDTAESEMIEAIEKLRSAVARNQPRPGRLRYAMLSTSLAAVAALAVFWLPNALMSHALSVAPQATLQAIGDKLQAQAVRVTGQPCDNLLAMPALRALEARLDVRRIVVVPSGLRQAAALPSGIILLSHTVVEDFEEPDVVAGFVIAAQQATPDPLRFLLEGGGAAASFRLLTTGAVTDALLRGHIEDLTRAAPPRASDEALIAAFESKRVRISPYAYALDASGEETLTLIEADPFTTTPEPVLSDRDWIALQGICGG